MTDICDKYIPKISVKFQFQPPWYDTDCDKILKDKEKWRAKANSESGTEEDHVKFRKLRSKFKKAMDEKMRLNVVDESDPSLNEYFYEQFCDESSYNIDIDMSTENQFMDLKFHSLDVLLLLKEVNSSKAAGPDGIHGIEELCSLIGQTSDYTVQYIICNRLHTG